MVDFIASHNFIRTFWNYKRLWLGGRVGGGKTLLSFAIARAMVKQGYARYILSNIPSVWSDDPDYVLANVRDYQYLDTVLIIDEGGMFIENRHQAKQFLAFLRKFNLYVILPTVEPPPTAFKAFAAYRSFDWKSVGIPAWTYKASYFAGQATRKTSREDMYFHLFNPRQYYGIYDTEATPVNADRIQSMLDRHSRNVYELQGIDPSTFTNDAMGEARWFFDDFAEEAEELKESLSLLPEQSGKQHRRRRV